MVTHPSELLPLYFDQAKDQLGGDCHFEFSKYVYIPQQISERRDVFRSHFQTALKSVQDQTSSLKQDEEIAFHSRLFSAKADRHMHIPMIDMGCDAIEPHLDELKRAFSDFNNHSFTIFHSGRSYHIYGHRLLKDDDELIRFMGRILLLNLPKQDRVIDERWVGHRLMAKYLTLRWTNNNPHYKSAPRGYLEINGASS